MSEKLTTLSQLRAVSQKSKDRAAQVADAAAADYVAVDVAPASSAVARAANFVATESRAGILRLRAASVPTAAISAQYHIITAATAAKEG